MADRTRPPRSSRRFELHRSQDVSGVSGTGIVADGVEFPDGTASLRWRGTFASFVAYEQGIRAVEAIHGHGGATKIVWLDDLIPSFDPDLPEVVFAVGASWRRCPGCSSHDAGAPWWRDAYGAHASGAAIRTWLSVLD